ncbi:MAG: enoyl-CoA hydratase/isomerase family protein [Acidimicrobiia bacterium]|jgi:2-(1,2-epoxy-1,2-dihydrophenyl)acetyl-CoA isomerase|nr:enoyl-CoA hydratase/isomerase family protein [Acidimicrobiia bacterium]MBA3983849.1 enoyl-CoA hydratase/isomerase family protein [Acidimicrobiia bacterium]MDQ3390727.1 enoyl-CoA hydratase-related protein [Actinomycetota bacterium]
MDDQPLLVDRVDGVVTVTLNRPQRKNAITGDMWIGLTTICNEIADRSDDRAVVLTGAGGEFCSGADLSGAPTRDRHDLFWMRTVGACCLAVANLPQPTIAKVSGVAVGAGMNLALACDLVAADTTARFSEIFSKRGLSVDFGGTWSLPRRIGLHRAKELALLGDIIDAAEAERLGLVNRVVAPGLLDGVVGDWAGRLAAGPPIALAQTKAMLNNSFAVTLAQALEAEGAAQALNFTTKDTVEALNAFVDKREPRFEGH